MTAEQIKDYITKQRHSVYDDIAHCSEHNYNMEAQALSYKSKAYTDVIGEVLMLISKVSMEEQNRSFESEK